MWPMERHGWKRALDPIERISEVLFGLIMVLTFTGSLSIAEAGRDDVRTMLIGALGCNLAWGIIDAVFYLLGALADKGRDLATLRAVQAADGPAARALVLEALPPLIAGVLEPAELDAVRARLQQQPPPPPGHPARLDAHDWRGALAVFLLVFLSTLPVALPFVVMRNAGPALRASNAVAVGLLFLAGYAFGRTAGRPPWRTGLAMVGLGLGLVALTMALGG